MSGTEVKLPKARYYAEMSSANLTGLLTGVYYQVAVVPCFSGSKIQKLILRSLNTF